MKCMIQPKRTMTPTQSKEAKWLLSYDPGFPQGFAKALSYC